MFLPLVLPDNQGEDQEWWNLLQRVLCGLHSTLWLTTYCPLKKNQQQTSPTKNWLWIEKKKLAYFGSGLSIILTDPAKARLLFKLSHFYRMESLKPMHECRISYRSPKWPCRKENTIMQEEETWVTNSSYSMYLRTSGRKLMKFSILEAFPSSKNLSPTKLLSLVEVSTYI